MITSDYWYKNAVLYGVDVETFMDSDDDGVGDIQGLISRLDYVERLGVDCLWLLPFYPSPDRDNGYDVTDYHGVDDRYGTLGDFVELAREADSRGIRLLIDLVTNHTSDQHPWFERARAEPDSKYRDYYVFAEDPPEPDAEPIFPEEESVWSYDEEADAYYFHHFYDFEPGLDISNPAVRNEIKQIMGFWLELGVSGFRFDAAPLMIRKKGLESTEMADPHAVFREFRRFIDRRSEDALLLGEAGGTPEEVRPFFGDGAFGGERSRGGDELNMLFDFLLAGYLFHGLATGEASSISEGLKIVPSPPETGQWANFLRTHDELNLEWLTETQRQDVFDAFAPEESMRIYDRGVRRRLAPMLDGDQRRIELAFSLLFSLPGTPLLYYGDEIGMGDDLSLEEREAVRTPMQWSTGENAGFSSAPADELAMPVIDEGPYAYEAANVDDQHFEGDSLLNRVEQFVSTRKEHPEIGWGEAEVFGVDSHSVFAHRIDWEERTMIAVHNLAGEEGTVKLDLGVDDDVTLVNLLGDHEYDAQQGSAAFELEPYGYRWLRVGGVQDATSRPAVGRSS